MNKLKKSEICQYALILIFVLAGILDLINVIKLKALHGGIMFIAVIMVLELILTLINKKFVKKEIEFLKKALVFVAILEITIFQCHSYHLLKGNYEYQELDISNATTTENYDMSSHENISADETFIEFKDLNVPIGTITIDAESNANVKANIYISIKDDSNAATYRDEVAKAEVIRNNKRSQTVTCNFSGKVHDLKISYDAEDDEYINISKICINKAIPYHFSALRMLLILLFIYGIYLLICSEILKKNFAENTKCVKITASIITLVFVVAALFIANIGRYQNPEHSLKNDFTMDSGNQITQEIVDAFKKGHVYLDIEPSEDLENLDNPYDWSERADEDVECEWDHVYYNGKYYSYYGIAPVLVLFLPYNLITGHYFPTVWAVWLFGCIGILFITLLWLEFIKKFHSKVRTSVAISGLIMMQLISGVWFCFCDPKFYEIAQTSGFACVLAGAYLLLRSNIITEGKISNVRVAVGTAMLSLGVLCRPTLAVYCMCSLILLYGGLKKIMVEKNTKKTVAYILSALLPFAIIGSVQMIYNYLRFDSVFDFGIQYSLTINDFTVSQYHTNFVLIGIFAYLFKAPVFSERFPFMSFEGINQFNPQGYYFVATDSNVGLLLKAPVLLSFFKMRRAYKITDNQNKRLYAVIILAISLIAPFVILYSIWESGYGSRYVMDFAWEMYIGAMTIALILYSKANNGIKNIFNKFMVYTTALCLINVFAQTYLWIQDDMSEKMSIASMTFARLFEFWM